MTRIVDGMLRKCGFANVDQVHDGPTALQKLREKSYLFVVSDREMPGMNGLELAREIRADPKIRCAAGNHVGEFRAATCGSRDRRGGQFFHD
jgi:CheY-like chemotaxis protein